MANPPPDLRLVAPRWAGTLLLLIVLIAAGASLNVLRLARDVLQAMETSAPVESAPMRQWDVAGARFAVPTDLVRFPAPAADKLPGTVRTARLELAVPWSVLQGFEQAGPAPGLSLALIAGGEPIPARARLQRIYQPFFEGDGIAGPDGLIGHRLAGASGYGGEILFYEAAEFEAVATDHGPFMVRCGAVTSNLAPAICLRQMSLSPNLRAEYRFRRERLGQWRRIESAASALIAQFHEAAAQ